MNLKSPLTLPILWNTDKAQELKELGLPCSEEPEIKKITFYTIDHVYTTVYGEDKKSATMICSAGYEFLCPDNLGVINSAILDKI